MRDLLDQIGELSPEKRALFELLLKQEGMDLEESRIRPQPRDSNAFPLSFAQQRLWFLDQLEPGSPLYNIPMALRLSGPLNPEVLKRSLAEVIRRHETLRTTFAVRDGQPFQIVASDLALPLKIVDLQDLAPDQKQAVVTRQAAEAARRSFDLGAGPLLEVTLLRLAPDDHVALLTLHHIVSDGWSMGVLIRELAALYDTFSHDRPSPLPPLPVQYVDFAVWQRERLRGQTLTTQLDYWREKLGGDLPVLQLPTDRPRPAMQTSRGASYTFDLPPDLTRQLARLSQQEDATLFMTLMAAFQVLLHRYSGQDDICIGTPVANRNRREIEGLIGFFVNTLVIRTDLSGNPSFRELLRQVREEAVGAFNHQDLPFEMLVEHLQPDRDLGHTPLFQAMFVLQNAPAETLKLPNLTISPIHSHSGTATFDLTLSMAEIDGQLSGAVEYNCDLFDESTIHRMMKHFQRMLEGIAADPGYPVDLLPLLDNDERKQLLEEWNHTQASHPLHAGLHHLFEQQAMHTPEAVAVVWPANSKDPDDGLELTYRELNQRANQVAHFLRQQGVGPESLVGISVERSPELIVGLLGILKAGGAYVPLDPSYPPERLAFMIADSGIETLLTQEYLLQRLPVSKEAGASVEGRTATSSASALTCVLLDADWPLISQQPHNNLANLTLPDNLAYVIYTSGSTGEPKGVMVPHSSVVNHNAAVVDLFDLRHSDRVLQFSTINFDAAVEEIFPTLHTGATLVLRRDDAPPTGADLLRLVEEEGITLLDLPTAYWHEWTRELADLGESVPDSLRLLVVGGEKALADRLSGWLRLQGQGAAFINSYGPTETTVISTAKVIASDTGRWDPGIDLPIGRPIDNTRIYVLDRYLQPVPVGVPGELVIGGLGVTRGYLNRPGLTAQRFVPDPYGQTPGARAYRTGDLVRYLPDGDVEFLGRVDNQVKIRGFRVEPGEVEAILSQHPSVLEAAVVTHQEETGYARLVAYTVPKDGHAGDIAALRGYLKEQLPDYMVPSVFLVLDALPLLPSGKLDRRRLPAPDDGFGEAQGFYTAPRTPTEEILAGIWTQVLGKGPVGASDDFFDLGGHSLLATQVISRVRQAFQVELPVRALFEQPTLAGLAARIDGAVREKAGLITPPLASVPRDGKLPLSYAQQRLWFLDQLEPNSPTYNIPDAVRIQGPLDVAAFKRSLDEIVDRHEILRTTFETVDGKPTQVIVPELTVSVPVVDLSHLPEEEREEQVRRLATTEARRPFDLSQGPLLRVTLLRVGPQEHVALLTMHHIVSDGWSAGVLILELAAFYRAFSTGQNPDLDGLPIQYADFAHWQRTWLAGDVLESQVSFWKERLAGMSPLLELPTDRPRQAMQTSNGSHKSFALPETLSERLKALSREEGATLFMTLLAAFQALLYRYSGQDDFGVGTPIANRNLAQIEGLIGFFVNTLVMRATLSGEMTFRQLIARTREFALGAYAHQDLPFEMLVDALQPRRDLSHTPLFQVMFLLQNAPSTDLSMPGLSMSQLDIESGLSAFDLTLILSEGREGLQGAFEFNTDLFDGSTVERMAGHFQVLLEGIVTNPDQAIGRLPLLIDKEKHQLTVDWNATASYVPASLCMHQLFEEQAARSPAVPAAVMPSQEPGSGRTFSYDQLNRLANQLAHHLHRLGVRPETLVGISMNRSLDMLVGLLGILKAGGAYLPLDPSYPADRLAYMIEDSQVRFIVTHGATAQRLPVQADVHMLHIDADWKAIALEPDYNPDVWMTPDNLAYVIYTSGSTGKPKGVQVVHRSVVNHNVAAAALFHLQPTDRVLQFATINFDAAVEEIFPTWYAGGTVVLRPDGVLPSGQELHRLIEAEGLTVLDLPTAYWHEWASELQLAGTRPPSCVRLVVVGGDKAIADRLAAWQQRTGVSITWLNTYGPTEGTIIASAYEPPKDHPWPADQEVPIGRPIANARLRILDRHGELVPVGVPGELHIGGLAVARGYLGRPGLTAQRFVPDPFAEAPVVATSQPSTGESAGSRLYKTGDLARFLPDGNIQFLGRVDHQVKIRGFRVEPGEVEAALAQSPEVSDVAVLAQEVRAGHMRLVAYVVPSTGSQLNTDLLRAHLRKHLPEYMLPSAYVIMEDLPLTPSGKVDRRALPEPSPGESPAEDHDAFAPRNPREAALIDIWTEVLGVRQIGIHDNFFELGGDSILSIQVVARATQAGLRLTPRQLFEHPTIAGLASVAGQGPAILAEQDIVTGPVPLTPIQHWFFEQSPPDPHHWNQALLLSVDHPLSPKHLEQAVAQLAAQHDALRLRFKQVGDDLSQENAGLDGPLPFDVIDLSEVTTEDQMAVLVTWATKIQSSLNLEAGPIFRVAYFDLGPARPARLLIVVHHLAMDGVSWRIMLEDLQSAYQQISRGESVRLPPKTTSFRQWATRLQGLANAEAVYQELAYWRSLQLPEPPQLPVDLHGGENSEASARSVVVSLSPEETRALLQDVPPVYQTEINDVLLTALAQAFHRWTGSRTLLVELESHGREEIAEDLDVSRTIGWFTAAYPLRLTLPTPASTLDGSAGEALKAIKEQLRQVPSRGLGYGLLRYLHRDPLVRQQLAKLPPPEISFNYLGQFTPGMGQLEQESARASSFSLAAEERGPDRSLRAPRGHILEIDGGIAGGQLRLEWTYSENHHRRSTVAQWAEDYLAALRAIIAHCQSPDAGGYTPTDFPLADLDQKKLDRLLGKLDRGKGQTR